jgi:hypothetical protein
VERMKRDGDRVQRESRGVEESNRQLKKEV